MEKEIIMRRCVRAGKCFFDKTCTHSDNHAETKTCATDKGTVCPYGIGKHIEARCKQVVTA
jgi:hypothetical protein